MSTLQNRKAAPAAQGDATDYAVRLLARSLKPKATARAIAMLEREAAMLEDWGNGQRLPANVVPIRGSTPEHRRFMAVCQSKAAACRALVEELAR
ncbi:hypothetical protein [Brevundimonas sp.]|uniref:hypothetical protein n=1 Tax=Brevundimonas sp. TaxID=1871086 RepID=UPI00351163D2